MSMYVYITRKPNPLEPEGPTIALSEWLGQLAHEGDFRPPSSEELASSGFPVPPAERSSIWSAHPEYPVVWFVWQDGQIEVKNADKLIIRRMRALATLLNARVVSETGEFFDESGGHAGFEPYSDYYEG